MKYESYLKSAEWRKVRAEIISRDGGMCRVCGSDRDLEVHHRNYENIGHETGRDLTTLCGACHTLYSAASRVTRPHRHDLEPDAIKVAHLKNRIAVLKTAEKDAPYEAQVDMCIERRSLERRLAELEAEED